MKSGEKSVLPVRHGVPNPFFGKAFDLIRNSEEFRHLAELVRAEAAALKAVGGDSSFTSIAARCTAVGVKDKLRQLYERNNSQPAEKPVMGPPPPVIELYGRFGDGVAITDIGSGNCMKLTRASGVLKITAVDPNIVNDGGLVLQSVKSTLGDFLAATGGWEERIFTSFMSLPQISFEEWRPLNNTDGIHVVPDHPLLVANRIAVVREDGKLLVRTMAKDYEDYPIDCLGVPLEPGYMHCVTFRKRDVVCALVDEPTVVSYSPEIDASPSGFYDLNFADISPKFDGVAHELEVTDGKVYLVDRAGRQRSGTTNIGFHFCLHVEELDECFTLIRIVSWRGYVPPHTGDVLRLFCATVNLRVGNKKLYGPPQWHPGELSGSFRLPGFGKLCPIDGAISRENGRDFYCKYQWTIDIMRERVPAISAALLDSGFGLLVDGEWFPGLNECAMSRRGAIVTIAPRKPRLDKFAETSTDTILYLVDRPLLSEVELITGSVNV